MARVLDLCATGSESVWGARSVQQVQRVGGVLDVCATGSESMWSAELS